MTRQEFIDNFIAAEKAVILPPANKEVQIICSLIGSIYDQQQMIDYLDTRLIELERAVYK